MSRRSSPDYHGPATMFMAMYDDHRLPEANTRHVLPAEAASQAPTALPASDAANDSSLLAAAEFENVIIDLDTGESATLTPPKEAEKIDTVWPAKAAGPSGTRSQTSSSTSTPTSAWMACSSKTTRTTMMPMSNSLSTHTASSRTWRTANRSSPLPKASSRPEFSSSRSLHDPCHHVQWRDDHAPDFHHAPVRQHPGALLRQRRLCSTIMPSNTHIGFSCFGQMADGTIEAIIPPRGYGVHRPGQDHARHPHLHHRLQPTTNQPTGHQPAT